MGKKLGAVMKDVVFSGVPKNPTVFQSNFMILPNYGVTCVMVWTTRKKLTVVTGLKKIGAICCKSVRLMSSTGKVVRTEFTSLRLFTIPTSNLTFPQTTIAYAGCCIVSCSSKLTRYLFRRRCR